jgi:hypothetical protein
MRFQFVCLICLDRIVAVKVIMRELLVPMLVLAMANVVIQQQLSAVLKHAKHI